MNLKSALEAARIKPESVQSWVIDNVNVDAEGEEKFEGTKITDDTVFDQHPHAVMIRLTSVDGSERSDSYQVFIVWKNVIATTHIRAVSRTPDWAEDIQDDVSILVRDLKKSTEEDNITIGFDKPYPIKIFSMESGTGKWINELIRPSKDKTYTIPMG